MTEFVEFRQRDRTMVRMPLQEARRLRLERAQKIVALRRQGWTLERIAAQENVSRERIRQLIRHAETGSR